MEKWKDVADSELLGIVKAALEKNGFGVFVVKNGEAAKDKVAEIIPEGAEVKTMTSVTLEKTGIADLIDNSDKYRSLKKVLLSMDRQAESQKIRQIGAAPDWAIGSVHAITEAGQILIASATGSQLPAYAYGARGVIWVVGAQKIVKDMEEAMKRIYEYVLPLESARARKAYGVEASSVNKILVFNKEATPGRIILILVKEAVGF